LAHSYPWNSPYAFSSNRVIDKIELEGAETATAENTANTVTKEVAKQTTHTYDEIVNAATRGAIETTTKVPWWQPALRAASTSAAVISFVVMPANASSQGTCHGIPLSQCPLSSEYVEPFSGEDVATSSPEVKVVDSPHAVTLPIEDPKKSPVDAETDEDKTYVYRTGRSVKWARGIVANDVTTLPYYGITDLPVIGGRYSANSTEGKNFDQLITMTDRYTAGGVESAIIILNSFGADALNYASLTAIFNTQTKFSTRIDNLTITYKQIDQILTGVTHLQSIYPDWATRFLESENEKGQTHPDTINERLNGTPTSQ